MEQVTFTSRKASASAEMGYFIACIEKSTGMDYPVTAVNRKNTFSVGMELIIDPDSAMQAEKGEWI